MATSPTRACVICPPARMMPDLFARAILEDGSALSPLVANNIHSTSSPLGQQVAHQHLRLLARLCDCPVTSNAGPTATATATAKSHSHTLFNSSGLSSPDASPLIIYECLRNAPVEQLVQKVPSSLIDTAASPTDSGELALARRWHKPVELLFRSIIELDQSIVSARVKMTLNEFSNRIFGAAPGDGQVTISRAQLDKLIAYLVAVRRLVSARGVTSGVWPAQPQPPPPPPPQPPSSPSSPLLADKQPEPSGVELVSDLLDVLLNAIYLPSNETFVGPLYTPQLDTGVILQPNEHDLSAAMLQSQSLFNRHDLLIGSSRPLIEFHRPLSGQDYGSAAQFQTADLSTARKRHKELSADSSYLLERFGRRVLEQEGFSDEQAIQQVNLFVRTFYRFHQQEIANSIINHYFLNEQQLDGPAGSSALFGGAYGRASTGGGDIKDSASSPPPPSNKRHDARQLQLLNSLASIYEDSLKSVPLIKTALIHSMKQLETLADVYASQRIAKLNERFIGSNGDVVKLAMREREALSESVTDDFPSFLRQLYGSPSSWPLGLISPGAPNNSHSLRDSVHSTYLYQFNRAETLVDAVAGVIKELERKLEREPKGRAILLSEIRNNLVDNLLLSLIMDPGSIEISLSCGLELMTSTDADSDLTDRLMKWCCLRLGREVVANFVAQGNVNARYSTPAQRTEFKWDIDSNNSEVESYDIGCRLAQASQRDHDSIQLIDQDSGQGLNSSLLSLENRVEPVPNEPMPHCRRLLDNLSMAYLFSELSRSAGQSDERNPWPVFNVFDQHIATLLRPSADGIWTSDRFTNDDIHPPVRPVDAQGDSRPLRENLDRKIAFWANFVPTLNCSRTQPIGANSLLFSRASNSSLLNMNLNFNCQTGSQFSSTATGATKTANSFIRSLESKIKLSIGDHLTQLARQQQLRAAAGGQKPDADNQNHHSLRMATTNEMSSSQAEDSNSVSSIQHTTRLAADTWLTADATNPADSSLFISANSRFRLMSLWLAAGILLAVSIFLASGFVLIRSLRRRRSVSDMDQAKQHSAKCEPPSEMNETAKLDASELNPAYTDNQQRLLSSSIASQALMPGQAPMSFDDANLISDQRDYSPREVGVTFQNHFSMPLAPGPEFMLSGDRIEDLTYSANLQMPECGSQAVDQLQVDLGPQAASSSSETTFTNRPHSSASPLTSSTMTTTHNNSNGNGSANTNLTGKSVESRKLANGRQQTKKRVKISDPKRLYEEAYMIDAGQLIEMSNEVNTSQNNLGAHFVVEPTSGQSQFCPIHRSSSAYLLTPRTNEVVRDLMSNPSCDNHDMNMDQFGRLEDLTRFQASESTTAITNYTNGFVEPDKFYGLTNGAVPNSPRASRGNSYNYRQLSTYDLGHREYRDGPHSSANVCLVHKQAEPRDRAIDLNLCDHFYKPHTLTR